jgi:hypothetical protein
VAKRKSKHLVIAPAFEIIKRDAKNHRKLFHSAMHYTQYEMSDKQLKRKFIAYAKSQKLDHKLLNVLTDKELACAGKYATVVVGGGELPEDIQESFDRYVADLLKHAKSVRAERRAAAKEKAKESKGPVLTVQDRMRMQAEEVCQEFDTWLDDLMFGKVKTIPKHMDPASKMKAAGFKAGQARWVKAFYEPELELVKEVMAGKDKDLKEGYSNIKKSSLLRTEKLLDKIITAANVIETVAKANRKTRVKKAPSVQKQIAKLKYCDHHDEYGVASVNPVGIVGAKEVWVFNTKYRKIGKYVAQDESGLTVKGTSIKDFSEAQSVQKTLRKPKEQLKDFMKAGKVRLRKFLDEIKAVDTKLNGRINNNIVILKIFR